MGLHDELIQVAMSKIDAMTVSDHERWHSEADDLIAECLLLDVSMEMRERIVEWFRNGVKWYA